MNKPHLPASKSEDHRRFEDGLRAIFTTTKAESDRQLAAEADRRKDARLVKRDAKKQPG